MKTKNKIIEKSPKGHKTKIQVAKRVKNKKQNKIIVTALFLSIFLCAAAFVLGYLASFYTSDYATEKSERVLVESVEDISKLGTAVYNDRLYLQNDIHISDASFRIGTADAPFAGIFDGCGYTVYLDYTEVGANVSLFDCLAISAEIRNVNFVFTNINITGVEFGGIAKINDGLIENCKLVYNGVKISSEGKFSPFVITNRGTIRNVFVEGNTVTGNVSSEQERNIFFGNLCVYNAGEISGIIVKTDYEGFESTDKLKNLKGEATNKAISAVRYSDVGGATSFAIAAIIPDDVQICDQTKGTELLSVDEVFVSDKIFYYFDFNNSYWKLDGQKLTLIKAGE